MTKSPHTGGERGIVPDFRGTGFTRKIQVHDRVPLTTKIKPNPYYFPMRFKDREQCVMLSQLRLWDGKRLTHKMGQLPDDQFEAVKQALRRLLK